MERHMILCFLCVLLLKLFTFAESASISLRSCSLDLNASTGVSFGLFTTTAFATDDTISIENLGLFANLSTCTVDSMAAPHFTVITIPSPSSIRLIVKQPRLSSLVFTLQCTVSVSSSVDVFPIANGVPCIASTVLTVSSNPIITDSGTEPITFFLRSPSLPVIELPLSSKIVFKHPTTKPAFMDGHITFPSCSCGKDGQTPAAVGVTSGSGDISLTVSTRMVLPYNCFCDAVISGYWNYQSFLVQIVSPAGQVMFESGPDQYLPYSSYPAASLSFDPPVYPQGYDVFKHGLPEMIFTILDKNSKPVYSNGNAHIELFPATLASLPHTPQIISPHKLTVKLTFAGKYTIPSGIARLAGYTTTTDTIIVATLVSGNGFRVPPTTIFTATFYVPHLSRPQPLWISSLGTIAYASVQRTQIHSNPGYQREVSVDAIEYSLYASAMGKYSSTLYLPQSNPLMDRGIGQYEGSGTPRPRTLAAEAKSVSQRRVYTVGGMVLQSGRRVDTRRQDAVLMDVWMYDVVAGSYQLLSGNQHTLGTPALGGYMAEFDHAFHPAARHSAAAAVDVDERFLYLHGGCADVDCTLIFQDLWVFDIQERMWAVMGGTATPQERPDACPSVALTPLFGHQMVTPGEDVSTDPTLVNDVNLGLKPTDKLFVFGGATFTPKNNIFSDIGPHFASNGMLEYTLTVDRTSNPPIIKTSYLTKLVSGVLCSTTLRPSEGAHRPLAGLLPPHALEIWLPPSAVYAGMTYDPYRQALWLYGGMHASYPFDVDKPATHDSPVRGRRDTASVPLTGLRSSNHFPLGDSGALSWLWKFDIASRKWVLMATTENHSPPLGRGAPRLAHFDNADALENHPGSRVLPAITVEPTRVYISGGLGHTVGAVLPSYPGKTDASLDLVVSPTTRADMFPLSLGLPSGVDPNTSGEFTLYTHAFYSPDMLTRAGLRPGMGLHGVEVLVRMHEQHQRVDSTDRISTDVILRSVVLPYEVSAVELRSLAASRGGGNILAYRQLMAREWVSVGVHRGDKDASWTGAFLSVTIIQRFLSPKPFLANAGTVSGAEMRDYMAASAFSYYYIGGMSGPSLTHNGIPTIMLRSQLLPVYNPLRMALPLTYSTYNPNLDDVWMLDISHDAFRQNVPPSLNGVRAVWEPLAGHLISTQPQYPPMHPTVSAVTDLPKLNTLTVGPRAGAILLAPRTPKATIRSTEVLYNLFLKGGFQVHADRSMYYPDSTEVPMMPPRTDVLPVPELTVYDDVWSFHFSDSCLPTQFAYTCLCGVESVSSAFSLTALLPKPRFRACEDVCSYHDCGDGICVNAAGRPQCMCNKALGASYTSTGDDFTVLCDTTLSQDAIVTNHRFVWTSSLPTYQKSTPASPGARFGAAVTTDNDGCVWLYGGVTHLLVYYRELWRHCPANDQWSLVWSPTSGASAVVLGDAADLTWPASHEVRPSSMGGEGEPGYAVKGALFFGYRGATHHITGRKLYDEDSLFLHATSPFQAHTVWEFKQSTNKWYLHYRYQGLSFPLTQYISPSNTGTVGGFYANAKPAVREGAAITTHDGNMFMYSGGLLIASASNIHGYHLDLWVYNTTLHQWALLWGRNVTPTKQVYENAVLGTANSARSPVARAGRMGEFAELNSPGCRVGAAAAMSPDGRFFYLHGGVRPSSHAQLLFSDDATADALKNAQLGYSGMEVLGDLWVFDTVVKQWAWLGGSLEPLSPGSHAGVYASPAQHDLNTPPPRFLHSMAIGTDGYLRLDRGATLRYTVNVMQWKEYLQLLNDLFMLYLPPLTTATQNMVGDALVQQGLSALHADELKLPGTVEHVVGDAPKWILILGDKTSPQLTPTENQGTFGRGLPGTDFVMEPVFGHTLLLVPAPIMFERAMAGKQRSANQVSLLRDELARQIYSQYTVSVGGASIAGSPPGVPTGPFVTIGVLRASKAFSYWWGSPCDYNICLNDGECEMQSGSGLFLDEAYAKCRCPPNVFGSACEHTYCDLYPCKNGGVCTITRDSPNTDVSCQCPEGYTGKFCDIETYIMTPLVDASSGEMRGPGYHLMAASTPISVLSRLVPMLMLPPSTRAFIISGGYVSKGSIRYNLLNNALAISAGTWLYSESTNQVVDLMRLVAERHGMPYVKAQVNTQPQYTVDAPWGVCNTCAHFGARAGHSIAFFTDNAFTPAANPVADGRPPPNDFLVVFGGTLARPGDNPLRTVYCNQLWEVNLGTGKARLVSGIREINYDAVQPTTTMTPRDFDPARTTPVHTIGEKMFLGKHPSVRAHHATQRLTTEGHTWLYVFGGIGGDIFGEVGFLGDLWRLDMMRSMPVADRPGEYEPNPNFLQWQFIGCSVARHGYVFDPESISTSTPLYISASAPALTGCPSARAHASITADAHGRLWLVGGVGARGPLDDVWVYDPVVGALGAWYKIQGTSHSGQDPAILTAAYAQGKLLRYVTALASGSDSAPFGTRSFTTTATYPELGAGCTIGEPCPMGSGYTHATLTNNADAALYAASNTRIGALVGAAATFTGSHVVLYGGLTRTRTYVPLYDKPSAGVLSLVPEVKMPFKIDTAAGRFYFLYTANDLTAVGLKSASVITQLAFGLDTPLSGSHTIGVKVLTVQTNMLKDVMDTIPVSSDIMVSPSTVHASGGYLTLSGLSLYVPTVHDSDTLVVVLEVQTTVAPRHSTVLSCSRTTTSTTNTLAQPFLGPDPTALLPQGRVIVARRDTATNAFTDHTFIACVPALRISTRHVAEMGPSNLLWHIDTMRPTVDLSKTRVTLVSGALPHAHHRARYRFHSHEDLGENGPSGPNDPIAAISYAYTHGLHAAVAEVCHDWLRRDNMLNQNLIPEALGADALLHNQAGYALQFEQNMPLPPEATIFSPVRSYPSATAFGTLFRSSADAVYLFGGVSTLQRIDSQLAVTPDNTFASSSALATYPRPALEVDSPPIYASPHIYSFGKPVTPAAFEAARPALLTVSFAPDFTTILLDFDQDTFVPTAETVYSAAACARVLDSASLSLVTASSKCAWASRRRFSVLLHESHTVQKGSLLGIRTFSVFSIDRVFAALAATRSVGTQASSSVLAVVAAVKESLPCHPLLLSAAGSSGAYGRRLLHKWVLLPHATEDNSAQIAAFQDILVRAADDVCTANYAGATGICVSELKLTAATAAAILLPGHTNTFELTVRNRFGDESTTSITIMRADDPAPTVTVERFQYRKEFSAPLLLAATVTASRCALAPTIVRRSLGIAWTLESGTHTVNFTDANEVVLNGYNLVMVPYGLLPGTYTFTATVTETHFNALGVARRLPTTTAPITVNIFTTAPTAALTGAVDRTVSLRYLRNGILARDLAVPNVVYADTSGTGEDPTQPQAVVTLSAATSTDPAANPATSSPLQTLQFAWQCRLSSDTPCFSGLTTSDGTLATLLPSTHTLSIATTTLEALSEVLVEDDYLIFSVTITRKIDSATAMATSWLRVDRTTDISVSLSLSSPHTTTSTALIHSQPHDMVVSAALSSSTTATEDPDAVVPVLRWYSNPPLNFTEIARDLSRPAHASDLVIPSSRLLPNTRYTFYVHLFDVADAPPADAYLDSNGVPVSTSTAFATTSLAVFVQDFPALGECELTALGPYAPMASMDLQTLNSTTCESGLCRLRASCRDWPEDTVFEWLLQTGDCGNQAPATTSASASVSAATTRGRGRGFGHRGVSSITDVHDTPRRSRTGIHAMAAAAGDRCEDMVQIAPGTAASAIQFVANIDAPAHLLVRVSLQKAVRYVSLPLPTPADGAEKNSAAMLAQVAAVLDEVEFGPGEDAEDEDASTSSTSQVSSLGRLYSVPQRVGHLRTNGVLGDGATVSVSPAAEVSAEQLQVLLSGANIINALLDKLPRASTAATASSGAATATFGDDDTAGVSAAANVAVAADGGAPGQPTHTRADLLLLQQRVLRVLTSDATNLATYGAMSPTHSTAQDLINSASSSSSSSSVVSEATLRAIAAPCTNPTTAYARVHCTDALVRAFTAYSARNIQEGVPTEVADNVLQRLAAIYDNFNATTLALSPARVLKPYTLADYAIDPTSLSATPQRTTPLPEDGSLTEADAALQRAHWEAVRISQQLLAAAKTAAFGDVALRQPESPPRLLVSDSISVLVDAQYVSNAPTTITIGSDFRVTLPTDLPSMLAAPAAEPFVTASHGRASAVGGSTLTATKQSQRGTLMLDDEDEAVDQDIASSSSMNERVRSVLSTPVPPYKQQLCASRENAAQTLRNVLSAYCGDVADEDEHGADVSVLTTTVGGVTATRTLDRSRDEAFAFARHVARSKSRVRSLSRAFVRAQAEDAPIDGLVPVVLKGTTMTKTLTSIISTAPALMRLVSADNRNDTHVASSSVVDVTMYNHTDAGRRDMSVDAAGLAQVQPLQWKPAQPPTGDHAATAAGASGASVSTLADASPSHFYFTFALPQLATARWAKLKKKPVPRCQFFLPTALTDGVVPAEDDGAAAGTGDGNTTTLSAPTVGEWSTEGCELVSVTATHATCKCSHLTYFRISFSLDDLFPSINLLSWADFANLTWANLMKYPAPLITCLVWLGALCALVAVAWVIDIHYDKRGLVELAEQWNQVMIASTDLSYVPSRAVVLDYKRYGLPQSPKDFDMCEYMLLSQYDQLGQWYVDVDALSMDQRQRKAAMKIRAATVRANDAHAIAAAKAAVAAAQEEMRIEEGNEEEEDEEMAMYEDAAAAEPTEVMVVLPEQLEDTHGDTAPAVEVAEVDVGVPAITPAIPEEDEEDEDATDEQEQQNEEPVTPPLPVETEEDLIYPAAEAVDEDDEEYDVVEDDVFDAMYPNTDTAPADTPAEAPAAMVVETMSEDDMLIHSTAFDAPAAPRRPGRLTISRSAYNERMKAKAKAKPPGQHALHQNRLFAAPYYAGAILAPSVTSAFDAEDTDADAALAGTDGPLANPPPPPAHAQPARGSVAALRRPTMSYPAADSTTSKRASISAYPAASSATSKRASVSNAAYPGAASTTGRRSIATVPYAAAGLADEGAPVFVTMTSIEAGMDAPYAADTGRGSVGAPPAFYAAKSVDTTAKAANRRASVVPPRPSLFSRPAFARPLTLRASVVAPESKAAVAASTRATFPLLTLPPPRPPAGQSDWREVGSTFGEKMKSDHPLLTLFMRSPTDDITFTGHVVMLMLMVLSGLAISAFFTENDEHEIIKDFIVGLITACLLMPVMVVLRYAIVENNHQRLVGFLQWYAELCCFLRYEQVKLLHLGLEATVPFGDGDEELVSMIKMAIRKQRIEEREHKEKEQRLQHSGVDEEAGVEMASMATGTAATGSAAGRGDVEAGANVSDKDDASGDESDADSEVSTFTPAHTRCECCNSTISCSFNALPPMYRLQLLPHSAYEQIATVAQMGEAALQRVPCRGEVEMREEQLLNELALLGAWDDLLAARAQDKNSVRVAVNKVQWREWLRWAEDTAVALGGAEDDAADAITTTFNTTSTSSASASTTAKPQRPVHDEEDEESSLLYNREEAAYRAELLHSRVDWTRSIGLSSGDADDETDVSDVVWIDTGVTPAGGDATATALAITAAAAKTRKTRKTTVPAPSSTASADVPLSRSIAASLCPAPALGWGIAPGLGGVPNENESVTVDTTFTMQHLPALDERAAQHYGNTPSPATSAYNYANGPASPRASEAPMPASPRSSNAAAVAAAPVIGGTVTPGSPRVSSASTAAAPRGSPSVSRVNSTIASKTANPALSLLHDPLPQLPVAVTAQRHNHIPSSAAVPLSPLPPPNPLVCPGPSLVQTSATARAQLLAALRQHTRIHIPHLLRFYDAYMPVMPRSVKGKLSVAFLVFWTLLCGFLVVVYGLQFDLAAAEAGDESNGFDFGKDAGEAESAGEWILNGLFGVALELVLYAPLLLLMDACVEARVQKKRERERAAWEYEQAAGIFNDTLQPSDDADAPEDAAIHLQGSSSANGTGTGVSCAEVEMVDMRAHTRAAAGDFDNSDEPAFATYPLASPVAPPLPLPSLALASSSASASTDTLTSPTHTSSAPCSPTPNTSLARTASSSPPTTTNPIRRTSSTTSSTAAGPSRSMERYHSLTERPDLTSADQRLMTVLQRMQIDFAPHRFFQAAALEYPLESAFPILGHMRADTFLRLCANKMKWSAATASGTGVHHPKDQASQDAAAAGGESVPGSAASNTTAPAAGDAKAAPVVARVGDGSSLNISGVSWLNDKHSKRHQRKKQSDARRSKVSMAADGTTDSSVPSAAGTLDGVPVTVVTADVDSYRRDSDAANSDDSTLCDARAEVARPTTGDTEAGDAGYTRQVLRFDMDTPTLYDTRGHALSISVVDAGAHRADTRTQL